jgi:hypothetical protein
VLIGLVVLGLLGTVWASRRSEGLLRPPRAISGALRRLARRWLLIGLGAAVIYAVLRNLF